MRDLRQDRFAGRGWIDRIDALAVVCYKAAANLRPHSTSRCLNNTLVPTTSVPTDAVAVVVGGGGGGAAAASLPPGCFLLLLLAAAPPTYETRSRPRQRDPKESKERPRCPQSRDTKFKLKYPRYTECRPGADFSRKKMLLLCMGRQGALPDPPEAAARPGAQVLTARSKPAYQSTEALWRKVHTVHPRRVEIV